MGWRVIGFIVEDYAFGRGGKWCDVTQYLYGNLSIGYCEQRDAIVEHDNSDVWVVCPDWRECCEVPNAWRMGRLTI